MGLSKRNVKAALKKRLRAAPYFFANESGQDMFRPKTVFNKLSC